MASSRRSQPEQPTDLAQLRKKKNRRRFLQRMLVLFVVCLGIGLVFFLRNDIQRLSLGMRMSDLLASYTPGGDFPQELPAGQIRSLAPIGKDLVVVGDSNLYVYNSQGKQTGSYFHGYGNPLSRTNGDRVITFDRGGKRFRVDSRSQELFSKTSDFTILSADISRGGHVAVASTSDRFQSQITVYDQEFDEIFIRSTADLVVDVRLDQKGTGMAVSSVDAAGGVLRTTITLLNFTQQEPVARVVLSDELVLSMTYLADGSLQVITDQRGVSLGADGTQKSEYRFSDAKVSRFVNLAEGGMFVLLDELGDGNNLHLISLDSALELRGDMMLDEKVISMDHGGGWIYVLTRTGVTAWGDDMKDERKLDLPQLYLAQPAGNYFYGITSDSIVLQKQDAPPKKTENRE